MSGEQLKLLSLDCPLSLKIDTYDTTSPRNTMGMQYVLPVSHLTAFFLFSLKSKLALSCQTKKTEKAVCSGLVTLRKIVTLQKFDQPAKHYHSFPRAMGHQYVIARQASRGETALTACTGSPLLIGARYDNHTFNFTFCTHI